MYIVIVPTPTDKYNRPVLYLMRLKQLKVIFLWYKKEHVQQMRPIEASLPVIWNKLVF